MKKFLLLGVAAMLGCAANAQTNLELVWQAETATTHTTAEVRGSMAALGKQAIVPNKTTGKIEIWESGAIVKEHDINTWVAAQGTIGSVDSVGNVTPYGLGLGVATDEVGNIVCNLNFPNMPSSQNFVVIPADGSDWFYLPVEIPEPAAVGRMDYLGGVAGNLNGGNAYMFLCPQNSEYVAIINVFEGEQDTDFSKARAMGYSFDSESIAYPVGSVATEDDPIPAFVVHTRGQAGLRYSDGETDPDKLYLDADSTVVVGFDKISTNSGFAVFNAAGKTYYVVNRGAADGSRYHDIAVKSLETGEEVAVYVYPTGQPTYYASGLAASVNEDGTVNIFQVIPGNSLSMFKFTPDASGVESTLADDNAAVEYYNLQGMKVANPENGLFIKKQGAKASKVVL